MCRAAGRGAKRAGKAVKALSESERLARAVDQGYLLDEPMYRGSNALVEVFDPATRGASTGRMSAKVADWTHSREDAAKGFADLAALKMGGKPIVQKLIPHREGFVEIDLSKGGHFRPAAGPLLDQKDQGTRVVKITGATDSAGGDKPGAVYAILDQKAVHDVNAKFDPKFKGQPGLMKALAGVGASIPLVGSIEGTQATDLPR